jgi:hypothetical protein
MDSAVPIHQTQGCEIAERQDFLRAVVGPGLAPEVQQCYRTLVNECLQRRRAKVLIVGNARWDAFNHLALRDALRSMALAGLAKGFRLALIAETPDLIAVYDAVLVEALRHGIEAKRFLTEEEAVRWLATVA